MHRIRTFIWQIVREHLFSPVILDQFVGALLPLLHEKVIAHLSRGFDIHVKDSLRPKVGPVEEYVVYESTRPATLWFLFDFADARAGDLFEIKLYTKLSHGEFLLHDHFELEGQRPMPMATLSERFAPACRLTITQSRGLSKEVRYEVFGRYEEK